MLAIVDPSSRQVLARIAVGNDPHEVIASADGKTAYVSNYGFGAYNTITVVDLVARKTVSTIDLGALRGPHGLALAGGKIWFTAEAAKAIGSYDLATKSIDWILGTGQNRTHMIYVSPDLKWIVTTNVSSGTVSIIEKVIGVVVRVARRQAVRRQQSHVRWSTTWKAARPGWADGCAQWRLEPDSRPCR